MKAEPVNQAWLHGALKTQQLHLRDAQGVCLESWPISTAKAGPGEQQNSGCTPRGWHRIRARIGAHLDPRAVLLGRRPTGEIWSPSLSQRFPQRDWILGRILWLCGEEPGFNRGGSVDSQRRFIYFHATPDDQPMGVPLSKGCIRLHPPAMQQVFELTFVGMRVFLDDQA